MAAEPFTPPATYAGAYAMMGATVVMPNGEIVRIGGCGSSGSEFHVSFTPTEGPHRWLAHWWSHRGFETAAECKARLWDEQADKLSATARKLIVAVLGDVFAREDRVTLKEPRRLAGVAKVRLHKAGKLEYEPCGRCGGSGHYSYNQISGTTCFGCNGKRVVFPSDGKALKAALKCDAVPD